MIDLPNILALHTARLILRAPVATDYPPFRAFYATDRSTHMGGPLEGDRAWRAFGHIIGHWVMRGFGMFTITDRITGQPLGMAGAWFPEGWPEREVGWSLWSDASEGTGLAHEAAKAVLAHVWTDLGWSTAVSYVDHGNTRSAALARRLGATIDPEGTSLAHGAPNHVWRHHPPEG